METPLVNCIPFVIEGISVCYTLVKQSKESYLFTLAVGEFTKKHIFDSKGKRLAISKGSVCDINGQTVAESIYLNRFIVVVTSYCGFWDGKSFPVTVRVDKVEPEVLEHLQDNPTTLQVRRAQKIVAAHKRNDEILNCIMVKGDTIPLK